MAIFNHSDQNRWTWMTQEPQGWWVVGGGWGEREQQAAGKLPPNRKQGPIRLQAGTVLVLMVLVSWRQMGA